MNDGLPPVPPRPDLGTPPPTATWRFVAPGSMRATAVVGAGVRLWAESWRRWFVLTLIMSGIVAVLIAAIDPWSGRYGLELWFEDPPAPQRDPEPVAVLLTLVSALFLGPWEIVILTRAALRSTFADPLRGPDLVGRTIRGVPSVLWIIVLLAVALIPLAFVLAALIAGVGPDARPLLLVVPLVAIFLLLPRLATMFEVFVGEDARGTKALAGAWRLSRGAWGFSMGVVLLSILIGIVVGVVPGVIVSEVFPAPSVGDSVGRAVVQSLTAGIVTPLGVAITVALYLELRARRGLADQTFLRARLDRFDSR